MSDRGTWYAAWGKRALDLVITVASLPIAAPLALLVALLVLIDLGRPVIFAQRRIGRGGAPFTLFKFRSMRDVRNLDGTMVDDARRITTLGAVLRRTSLDELPELLNVLRGQMSLVGPRPLLPRYLTRYTPRQARRHEVRPGLTGLAQLRGRNATSWSARLEADVEYVDRVGLGLDFSILIATIPLVLSSRGVSAEGHATMPEFDGQETRRTDE